LNVYGWQGVSGPPNLPKEVVDKWDKVIQEASKDPAFLDQAAKIYKVIAYLGPKEFWNSCRTNTRDICRWPSRWG